MEREREQNRTAYRNVWYIVDLHVIQVCDDWNGI